MTIGEITTLAVLVSGAIFWIAKLEMNVRANTKDIAGVAKSLRCQIEKSRLEWREQRREDLDRLDRTLVEIKDEILRMRGL